MSYDGSSEILSGNLRAHGTSDFTLPNSTYALVSFTADVSHATEPWTGLYRRKGEIQRIGLSEGEQVGSREIHRGFHAAGIHGGVARALCGWFLLHASTFVPVRPCPEHTFSSLAWLRFMHSGD